MVSGAVMTCHHSRPLMPKVLTVALASVVAIIAAQTSSHALHKNR
jgi:hypothetical protein